MLSSHRKLVDCACSYLILTRELTREDNTTNNVHCESSFPTSQEFPASLGKPKTLPSVVSPSSAAALITSHLSEMMHVGKMLIPRRWQGMNDDLHVRPPSQGG